MKQSRAMGRIWPDGEFVLWAEVTKDISDPEQAIPLGLSEVSNSHSVPEDSKERLRRGLGGITKHGQRMVKSAAYLLQQKYGAAQLSFLTCTIPGSPEETIEVAMAWSEIVRSFYQKLKRKLVGAHLSPGIVGVTEIQPKRFKRTGGMPLHLHIVFQGAPSDYCWAFAPRDFTSWWRDTVSAIVPQMAKYSFASATNVQKVKKSAAGYLGKYMSKGEADIKEIVDECPEVVDALPHSWYNLTKEARSGVKSYTRYGPEVGEMLEGWKKIDSDRPSPFKFIGRGKIRDSEGVVIATFEFGTIEAWAKKMAGLPLTKWDITCI